MDGVQPQASTRSTTPSGAFAGQRAPATKKGRRPATNPRILWIGPAFYLIADRDQRFTFKPADAMTLRRMLKGSPNKQSLRKDRVNNQIKKLFDREWFAEKYGAEIPAGADPLDYYLANVEKFELAPNPFFDPIWYTKACAGIDMKGLSPIEHYILHGDAAGLNPGPLFHTTFFRELNPAIPANDTALAHFVTAAKTAYPNPLFDSEWYAARYKVTDALPLKHYVTTGWLEDFDPSPMFSTAYYRIACPEIDAAGLNPLADYLDGGDRKGRDPSPYFNSSWYLTMYPDIAASTMNALAHYLQYGYHEGRRPSAS
jgi:hypothetical protein